MGYSWSRKISFSCFNVLSRFKLEFFVLNIEIDSQVALLIYDVTRRDSLNSLRKWFTELKENGPKDLCILLLRNSIDQIIVIIVVGNKIDLFDKEEVKMEEGKAFAEVISENNSISKIKRNLELTLSLRVQKWILVLM